MTKRLLSAEFVLPGHPDKLCDAVADALVQEASRREKRALCGVEVAVHRESVFITGRIGCVDAESIDIDGVVRSVFARAGYSRDWRPAPEDLKIAFDLCRCPLNDGEAAFRAVADDQCIVVGYAVDSPATNHLPPEQWLASRLQRRLVRLIDEAPALLLGPDGKLIVFVEEDGDARRLVSFSASLQQAAGASEIELHRAVRLVVQQELEHLAATLPGFDARLPDECLVNAAGNFIVGGPEGDNGLSGKKLVVDAYGPRVPIGGGALSGKDFFKADRAGAIVARRLARAVTTTGAARECTATVAFVPGGEEARVVSLVDEAGRMLPTGRWERLVDRSLARTGERCTNRVDLVKTAQFGHFTDADHPWERLAFDDDRFAFERIAT